MTRTWEIEYGQKNGVPLQQSLEKIWSIDENLWGRSIEGGRLEEPDYAPPEEIFKWTKSPESAEGQSKIVEIEFVNGSPIAVNDERFPAHLLVQHLNLLAGNYGIGRIDIMEDRMLGLKVRENYECPAAMTLIAAHKALEALVLTKEELQFKITVDQLWSDLAYRGLWHDPLKSDLEAFINRTQERVTGLVRLKFCRGNMQVIGRKSAWSLYDPNLASFDTADFDQRESTGAVKNFGLQAQMYRILLQKHEALLQ